MGSVSARLRLEGEAQLPDCAAHVWAWFGELHARRGSNGFGAEPLAFRDVQAWVALTAVRIRGHEIDWLFDLDQAYMSAQAKASRKDTR